MQIPESRRAKLTGKGAPPKFVGIPRDVADSPQFGALSGNAVKFIVEIARRYRGPGSNNGDLQLTWEEAEQRGWNSSGTLHKAKLEAIDAGFVVTSRKGGRNKCTLYALTFWPVDDCKGKHEWPPSRVPSNDWKLKVALPIRTNLLPIRTSDQLKEAA